MAFMAVVANAMDPHDFLIRADGTQPVALTGGDSPATYSVTCASATTPGTATLLRPAVTNRSRRTVCFHNSGNITVAIGSSTISASDLYLLGESTNSATLPTYCTNSSGAYYCATTGTNVTAQTVTVLEESQSIP